MMGEALGIDLRVAACAAARWRDGRVEPCVLGDGGAAVPTADLMAEAGGSPTAVVDAVEATRGALLAVAQRALQGAEVEAVGVAHALAPGDGPRALAEQAAAAAFGPVFLVPRPVAVAARFLEGGGPPGGEVAVLDVDGQDVDVAVVRHGRDGFDVLGTSRVEPPSSEAVDVAAHLDRAVSALEAVLAEAVGGPRGVHAVVAAGRPEWLDQLAIQVRVATGLTVTVDPQPDVAAALGAALLAGGPERRGRSRVAGAAAVAGPVAAPLVAPLVTSGPTATAAAGTALGEGLAETGGEAGSGVGALLRDAGAAGDGGLGGAVGDAVGEGLAETGGEAGSGVGALLRDAGAAGDGGLGDAAGDAVGEALAPDAPSGGAPAREAGSVDAEVPTRAVGGDGPRRLPGAADAPGRAGADPGVVLGGAFGDGDGERERRAGGGRRRVAVAAAVAAALLVLGGAMTAVGGGDGGGDGTDDVATGPGAGGRTSTTRASRDGRPDRGEATTTVPGTPVLAGRDGAPGEAVPAGTGPATTVAGTGTPAAPGSPTPSGGSTPTTLAGPGDPPPTTATTAAADTSGPSVSGLTRTPSTLTEEGFEFCAGPFTSVLTASISDPSGVTSAAVTWSGNGDSGAAAMTSSGTTWQATLGPVADNPALGYGQSDTVTWTVTALDGAGNATSVTGPSITVQGC